MQKAPAAARAFLSMTRRRGYHPDKIMRLRPLLPGTCEVCRRLYLVVVVVVVVLVLPVDMPELHTWTERMAVSASVRLV